MKKKKKNEFYFDNQINSIFEIEIVCLYCQFWSVSLRRCWIKVLIFQKNILKQYLKKVEYGPFRNRGTVGILMKTDKERSSNRRDRVSAGE